MTGAWATAVILTLGQRLGGKRGHALQPLAWAFLLSVQGMVWLASGLSTVSYTHLDVYKRQIFSRIPNKMDSMNDRLHPSVAAALAAPETPPANGARILLETLIAHGVDTVFGYPGGAVLPLYDALYAEPRLRHVLVRHEQAAVHAAEGYARTTGRTGVVFVTSGPGMANTTSGLLLSLIHI